MSFELRSVINYRFNYGCVARLGFASTAERHSHVANSRKVSQGAPSTVFSSYRRAAATVEVGRKICVTGWYGDDH